MQKWLCATTLIDALTGRRVPNDGDRPPGHAVPAGTTLHEPGALPGLEGLPHGVTLSIATSLDLAPLRLDRDPRGNEKRPYAYTLAELEAALAHPDVTRDRVVRGAGPPERGRYLALYDALAAWTAHVRRERRDRAPGEALVGPATEVLDPVLLDVHHECRVRLSEQGRHWVEGRAMRIPKSAAWDVERCLRAGLDACSEVLGHALDDQLGAIAAREGVPHRLPLVEPPPAPNALQCAYHLLGPLYDHPRLRSPDRRGASARRSRTTATPSGSAPSAKPCRRRYGQRSPRHG